MSYSKPAEIIVSLPYLLPLWILKFAFFDRTLYPVQGFT